MTNLHEVGEIYYLHQICGVSGSVYTMIPTTLETKFKNLTQG